MAADDDKYKPTTGRFGRLARLASLSARLSTDVVSRGVKRFTGRNDKGPKESMLGAGAAEKMVATLGDLKGLAMKLGQAVSMDPDLLTPEVRAVVARLQNQAPPMPWATVREVLTQELGRPPEEAYASIEEVPLASASLGQVHTAVTREGVKVAVKVQYPEIAKALQSDLENLSAMVNVVALSTRMLHGKGYFAELQASLLEELDYREEAQRARLFAEAAATLPELVVPKVFDELTSERVLTMELLEGETLKDFFARLGEHSADQKFQAARLLIRSIWGPFLKTGVIHGDPHPGNFMVLSDGRMGVLDFGAIRKLPDAWLDVNRRLYRALVDSQPYDGVGLSKQSNFVLDGEDDEVRSFIEDLIHLATRAVRSADFDYSKSTINRDMKAHFLTNAMKVRKIRPPKEAVLFFRAIGGLSQNLENLGARGDFHRVYKELIDFVVPVT